MRDNKRFRRYKPSLPEIEFSIPRPAYRKLPIWVKRFFPNNRLTVGYLISTNSFKANKAQKLGWFNGVVHLTPSTKIGLPGVNLCGADTDECRKACLDDSGQLGCPSGQKAMAARTLFLLFHQELFAQRLLLETERLQAFCTRHGFRLGLRLNGTSDRPFESRKYGRLLQAILASFPDVVLYDYTKHFPRATAAYRRSHGIGPYHITFSYSGKNWHHCQTLLRQGVNAAVTFAGPLPKKWRRYRVHNGDLHDLRFLDPKPRIVALRFKTVLDGRGGTVKPADARGFVVAQAA